MAAFVVASATLRFASATRRANSAGSGSAVMGVAAGLAGSEVGGGAGVGAGFTAEGAPPGALRPMAANLAATSARFWASKTAVDLYSLLVCFEA